MKYYERFQELLPKFIEREEKYNFEENKDLYDYRDFLAVIRTKTRRFEISNDPDDLEDIVAYGLMIYDLTKEEDV